MGNEKGLEVGKGKEETKTIWRTRKCGKEKGKKRKGRSGKRKKYGNLKSEEG